MKTLQCTKIETVLGVNQDHTLTAIGNNHLFHVGGLRVFAGKYGGFQISNLVHTYDLLNYEWRKKEAIPLEVTEAGRGEEEEAAGACGGDGAQ